MKKPKAIVLLAAGINCDRETEYAFQLAGANAERVHTNDLISGVRDLCEFHILVIPGGFSFGDDIASGKVLANKLKYKLGEKIHQFIEQKKLVIGICNGFQVMVKLGLLPGFNGDYKTQLTTLTYNDSSRFEDRWVYLRINQNSNCVFSQGITDLLYLPVRHGEGKFIPQGNKVLKQVKQNNQIVFQYVDASGDFGDYPVNPNGSVGSIAGICDETGLLFGLMPHPEGYVTRTQHPRWTREDLPPEGQGLRIFRNAVNYARENLV